MIDLDVNSEIKGRFSIEDVASDNEEEFKNMLPESFREFQSNQVFTSFEKTKFHYSNKKEFIYKEVTSPKEFHCEVFNENTKNYNDFNTIWNSLKTSTNMDESNFLDLLFNVHKEKEIIKITDFFETHSDFKDNLLIHNEFNEKTQKEDIKIYNKVNNENFNEKNKELVVTDRITALNSTLDSCLNLKKFCSIGTQTDFTIEPEFKKSLKSNQQEKTNKLALKKKNKKMIKRKSKNCDKSNVDLPYKSETFNELNIEIDNQNIFKLKDIDEMSPIIRNNPEINYKTFYRSVSRRKHENAISSNNIKSYGFSVYQTQAIEIPPFEFRNENVCSFTILNTKLQRCEDCAIKFQKNLHKNVQIN